MAKREVSKAEFDAHLAAWPRELKRDVLGTFEPPLVTYNDFTYGTWPDSVVASYRLGYETGDPPDGWAIHKERIP